MKKSRIDYLITQVQLSTNITKIKTPSYRLGFVNPVKEMYIAIQNSATLSRIMKYLIIQIQFHLIQTIITSYQ
jgi:hypothetical protein